MNIPDLFALTTQTKPSSMLRNGGPTEPQRDLTRKMEGGPANGTKEDGSEVTDTRRTNGSSEDSQTTSSQQSVGEEFDTFLTLLTAQIKNQDPLAPLDSTQFVEQLATFSNLELQAKGNQVLEDIAQMLAQNLYNQAQDQTPTES